MRSWPVATQSDGSVDKDLTSDEGLLATWRALCHLARKGKVRNVGVSNFSATKLARLAHAAKEEDLAVPSINQVELSLQCAQPRLVQVRLSVTVDLLALTQQHSGLRGTASCCRPTRHSAPRVLVCATTRSSQSSPGAKVSILRAS